MAQGYNDIVIFRNRSTYRYSYGDVPEEGTMQVMQQDIGAESRRSVVKFENAHFVLYGGTLYKYQNWLYYPLNAQRVKFESYDNFTRRFQHAVSIVERRCLVWHNGSVYAYNLDTETWSEWESIHRVAYFMTVPRRSEESAEQLYFGISGDAAQNESGLSDFCVFRIENSSVSSVGSEEFRCSLQTKIYDFETPVEWKRLYFWAVDVTTARPVRAVAVPVFAVPEREVTVHWDELSRDGQYDNQFYNWDELDQANDEDVVWSTWDRPKTPGAVETVIDDFPQGKLLRLEAKLDQGLRFRRIYFELYLDCDGTALTSPVQVFSIIPMIGAKAKIAKGAN